MDHRNPDLPLGGGRGRRSGGETVAGGSRILRRNEIGSQSPDVDGDQIEALLFGAYALKTIRKGRVQCGFETGALFSIDSQIQNAYAPSSSGGDQVAVSEDLILLVIDYFAGGLGFAYEYQFNKISGLGGIFGFSTGGGWRTWLAAVTLYFHPQSPLYFLVAPGIEFDDSDSDLFLRVGVGYEFEFNPRWSLVPAFNVDFVENDDTKFVYGFGVVYAF